MASALSKRVLIRWLLDQGFTEEKRKKTSHRAFSRDGIKITISAHGRADFSRKHTGQLRRQLLPLGLPFPGEEG